MSKKSLKVLLIIEQCNPKMSSTPLIGFNLFQAIHKLAEVTLVTRDFNQKALERHGYTEQVVYISKSNSSKSQNFRKAIVSRIKNEAIRRPIGTALRYPDYEDFNNQVYQKFKQSVLRGDYDIVHAITPIHTRYPVKIVKACKDIPFILGPVNGGVPFPEWFEEITIKKYLNLSFLPDLAKFIIPGYLDTYKQAEKILVGSSYTLNKLQAFFRFPDSKMCLLSENGVSSHFCADQAKIKKDSKVNLLFVGRLVAFKCPDILIEAVSRLNETIKSKIQLTFVGDGQERSNLEQMVQTRNLDDIVNFVGKITQAETLEYYRKADIFSFPSIRESGGAVVLEAMACGLPCIVANTGGVVDYMTEEAGFKIEPISREYLTQELTNKIEILVKNEHLRERMSAKAIERVREFEWGRKAKKIVKIYEEVLA
ncbi:MAG: glycosyltransferase family 4 protein [Coleofasciculus chthonoplastes F3-SA18-01]|jgi:glycosyltransferase involved in cell wall biosynthesis|uniref:glycosyltransferase family 4 protein n=1 Tax=Coleofasciculus chthonoplastes TaxID=64178 RepID=UPI0032FBF3B2